MPLDGTPNRYPKKKIPKSFSKDDKRGFCVRGDNKQLICQGDSGSPAVWKNKNGVEYLIGVAFMAPKNVVENG